MEIAEAILAADGVGAIAAAMEAMAAVETGAEVVIEALT
jgi:hypothetical protein